MVMVSADIPRQRPKRARKAMKARKAKKVKRAKTLKLKRTTKIALNPSASHACAPSVAKSWAKKLKAPFGVWGCAEHMVLGEL